MILEEIASMETHRRGLDGRWIFTARKHRFALLDLSHFVKPLLLAQFNSWTRGTIRRLANNSSPLSAVVLLFPSSIPACKY